MKRRLLTILVLAVLLAGIVCAASALADTLYATVTSSNGFGVRLRTGPGKDYAVITKYPVGTEVTVLQRGTTWSQIQVGTTTGWMQNDYLIFGKGGSGGSTEYTYKAYIVSDNGLRVWIRATSGGKKLALLSPGTAVNIIEYNTDWCKINANGIIGYVMTRYISVEQIDVIEYALTGVSVDVLNPQSGDILTATVLPANATVTYKWYLKKGGTTTLLGTDQYLTVTDSHRGGTITVTATGTGSYAGTVSFTTNAVAEETWVSSVSLSDSTPYVGETLSAQVVPTTADVLYSWRCNGVEVSTDAEYTVQAEDVGKLIQIKVTGQGVNQGVASDTASAEVTSLKSLQTIQLSNEYPVIGEILSVTASPANIDVAYAWYADGELVSNSNSYTVQSQDVGKKIQVMATALEPYSGTASACTYAVSSSLIKSVTLSTTAPVVGDTVEVIIFPLDCSTVCDWYLDGSTKIAGVSGTKLYIKPEYEGHTISVQATATGIYGGKASTGESNTVVAYPTVVAVKIDNTNPIVGNKLTADVVFYPAVTDSAKYASLVNQTTFLWRVGTVMKSGENTKNYTVADSDMGYPIQVKVVNGPDGSVYNISSDYTSAVQVVQAISGVSLYNSTTGADPVSVYPEPGQVLVACSNPDYADAEGCVKYHWFIGNTYISDGDTFTIPVQYSNGTEMVYSYGQQVTVVAEAQLPYYGYATCTSAQVVYLFTPSLNFIVPVPERGNTPTYYTAAVIYTPDGQYYATVDAYIQWGVRDGSSFTVLPLDEYGAFLPNTQYDAMLYYELPTGFTSYNADIRVNGNKVPEDQKTTGALYYSFPTTSGDMPITQLYITEIPTPVAGEKAVTSFETEQYTAVVKWTKGVKDDRTIENVNDYECSVIVTPKYGYSLAALPNNAFMVSTADSTSYSAGGNTITAKFHVSRQLRLESDTSVVYLDGSKDRMVFFSATLDGVEDPAITWTVLGDVTQTGTWISSDGLLTIDKDETVGKDLTVVATATYCGETYTASMKVTIESGSTSDEIKVVFKKVVNSVTISGTAQTVQFEAYAINSEDGVEYYVLPENVSSSDTVMNRNTGVLTVAADEQADYLTVMAVSKEDQNVFAKWELIVVHEKHEIVLDSLLAYTWKTKIITDVENGTSVSAIEAMLPGSVDIVTEKGTATSAPIVWDLSSYDPTYTGAYEWHFTGIIKLPSNVDNANGLSLKVEAEVDTLAKGVEYIVKEVIKPSAVTGVANGTLLSEITLPDKVSVIITEDGYPKTITADVVWDLSTVTNYDSAITEATQTFAVKGLVKLPSAIKNPDEVSLVTSVSVTVLEYGAANNLLSIDWTGFCDTVVPYGTNLSELESGLSNVVSIDTAYGPMFANVSWTFSGYTEGETHEQHVTATATANLPVGVTNDLGLSLTHTITVTIEAKPADLLVTEAKYDTVLYKGDTDAIIEIYLKNDGVAKVSNLCVELKDGFTTSYVNGSAVLMEGETYMITVHADPSKLETGTYPIKLTYDGGTTSTVVVPVDLVIVPVLQVTIEAYPYTVVPEGTEVTLTANVTGGFGGETYAWETGSTESTAIYTVNAEATIKVKVTDSEGHVAEDTIALKLYSPMEATISASPSGIINPGDPVTLTVQASKGTLVYYYYWETTETTDQITVNPTSDASYHVVVTDGITTIPLSIAVDVQDYVPMEASISASPSGTINSGDSVTLTVHPSKGTGTYYYYWETGETTDHINVSPSSDAVYHVLVTDGITTLPLSIAIDVN